MESNGIKHTLTGTVLGAVVCTDLIHMSECCIACVCHSPGCLPFCSHLSLLCIHPYPDPEKGRWTPSTLCTFHCLCVRETCWLLTAGPESPISPLPPLSPGGPVSPVSPLGPWRQIIESQFNDKHKQIYKTLCVISQPYLLPIGCCWAR